MTRRAKPTPKPKKGDVLARVGHWTIICNEPGYSMLLQYEDGERRFTTHTSAHALMLAVIEAMHRDPAKELVP